ncbi:MAG: response regulator [Myxococcaceae bacterium]
MSLTVLLVDGEQVVVESIRTALSRRSVEVDATSDGKGCVERVRKTRPNAVVLAVELPAGQNGYLICGKLKKDEELRKTPVIIIGNPDGFEGHKKLPRMRADDYVAKPVDVATLLERLGKLIDLPTESADEDSVGLTDVLDEEASEDEIAEEIALEPDALVDEAPANDLSALDAALDSSETPEEPVVVDDNVSHEASSDAGEELPEHPAEYPISTDEALDALGEDSPPERAPPAETQEEAEPPPPVPLRTGASADAAELRSLRARVSELQDTLTEAEQRVAELEAQPKSTNGKTDKDFFALKEQATKKDKEILRLKSELNAKEQAEIDLREREMHLEQQASTHAAELAKRDSQIRTLQAEKKRAETRAEQATSELNELGETASRANELEQEAKRLRTRVSELETANAKHEERLAKLYQRIKNDEKLRERTKKALGIASQLLNEPSGDADPDSTAASDDEAA